MAGRYEGHPTLIPQLWSLCVLPETWTNRATLKVIKEIDNFYIFQIGMPCPETKDYQERGRGFVLAAGKGQDSPLLTFLEQVRGTQKSQIPIGHCALLSKSNQVCLKPNVTDETEYLHSSPSSLLLSVLPQGSPLDPRICRCPHAVVWLGHLKPQEVLLAWANSKEKVPSPFCKSPLLTLPMNSMGKTKLLHLEIKQGCFGSLPPDFLSWFSHQPFHRPLLCAPARQQEHIQDGKAVLITCPAIIDESSHAHVLRYDLTPPSGPQREDITGGCLNNLYSGWGMASMDVDHMALTCGREGMVSTEWNYLVLPLWLDPFDPIHGTESATPKAQRQNSGAKKHLSLIREADFQMNFETLLEGNASKMGEMTGFSIAACDVNGDGLDEVIVGIPFGRVEQNSGWKEMGSVIVKGMGEPKTIFGYSEYSRFGSSVACVGDLNKDNFTDIAVGAPEHPEGGALFLYFGSKNGLIEEPSQVDV
ncbi:integrin subunit alpha 8 [Halocaridina rubra]|uniref:Integrin subunit alpha 8 n=1 Tax=Halocaridina rubra TaxID=373956 RepID=A0AAN9FUG7_HALRR